MSDNNTLEQIKKKASEWLSPKYDQTTRDEVEKLLSNRSMAEGLIERAQKVHSKNKKVGLRDKLSAYVAGAHRYLTKPCKPDEIYECLQGFLCPYDDQGSSIATEIDIMRRS